MTDIKTFKDIDKNLKKLVDEIRNNFNKTERQRDISTKLLDNVAELVGNIEQGKGPTTKIQKEMLRVLETSEAQDKVRARDQASADYKTGQATVEQLKKLHLSRADFLNAGFGQIDSSIESMRQWWQETVGQFSQAIKSWWENTKKNSIIWQAGIKIWNSETVKSLRAIGSKISSIIGRNLQEVLGEFSEVFDLFKETISTIYNAFKNFFVGAFDLVKERRKEWREKRMENHLEKIKNGIGKLVNRDAVEDISKPVGQKGPGMMAGLLDFLGFSKLAGILSGAGLAGLFGGLGAMLVSAGVIAALGSMLVNSLLDGIKAWQAGEDAETVSKAWLLGLTKLPRIVLGWLFKKMGWEKMSGAMSDEKTSGFIDKMNLGIKTFLDNMIEWFTNTWRSITETAKRYFNKAVDAIPFLSESKKSSMKMIVGNQEEFLKEKASLDAKAQALMATPGGATKANVRQNYMALLSDTERLLKEAQASQSSENQHNSKNFLELLKLQKELNENMKTAVESAPDKIKHGQIYGRSGAFYPIPAGESNLNKIPDVDSQLNRNNKNWDGVMK